MAVDHAQSGLSGFQLRLRLVNRKRFHGHQILSNYKLILTFAILTIDRVLN